MKEGWEMVKLGEVLKLNLDSVDVNSMPEFPFAGVYSFGNGLFQRGNQSGSDTSYKTFNRLHKNQIAVSKVKGWEGAIALVTEDFEGLFLSPICPTFDLVSEQIADIRFIDWFLKQSFVWQKLLDDSKGIGARRNSISEKQFLNLEIPLPSLPEQQRIAGRLAALKGKIDAVRGLRGEQEREMRRLLLAQYRNIIEGAEWMPMKEVAPIVRREVAISENESYPELGIRSFGKGTFHKPALNGLEVGTKRLYRIHKGDLLFSNVFAWEGAIAVAQPQDDGRFGSHRFISCLCKDGMALPEFLCFYFLTEKGMQDINAASPGGAGRNKTLGLNKLEQILVPVPDIHLQNDFLQLQSKTEQLKSAQAEQLAGLEGLFPAVLERAFRGEW